jgi:hypothetical protein
VHETVGQPSLSPSLRFHGPATGMYNPRPGLRNYGLDVETGSARARGIAGVKAYGAALRQSTTCDVTLAAGPVREQPHRPPPYRAGAMGTPACSALKHLPREWRLRRGREAPVRGHPPRAEECRIRVNHTRRNDQSRAEAGVGLRLARGSVGFADRSAARWRGTMGGQAAMTARLHPHQTRRSTDCAPPPTGTSRSLGPTSTVRRRRGADRAPRCAHRERPVPPRARP